MDVRGAEETSIAAKEQLHLTAIPREIITGEVLLFMDEDPSFFADLAKIRNKMHLAQTCSFFHKSLHTEILTHYLLLCVYANNYSELARIISFHPELLINTIPFYAPDGNREIISPAQLTFRQLNIYMFQFMWDQLQTIAASRNDIALLENFELHLNEWLLHNKLQTYGEKYIAALTPVYDKFEAARKRSELDEEDPHHLTRQDLNDAWLAHGAGLRKLILTGLLPLHALYEFTRPFDADKNEVNTWQLTSTFDPTVLPRPQTCEVLNYDTFETLSLLPLVEEKGLGTYSIIRGSAGVARCGETVTNGGFGCKAGLALDLMIFRRLLCDIRPKQVIALLEKISSANTPHYRRKSTSQYQ